jgi:hypothetical protein
MRFSGVGGAKYGTHSRREEGLTDSEGLTRHGGMIWPAAAKCKMLLRHRRFDREALNGKDITWSMDGISIA